MRFEDEILLENGFVKTDRGEYMVAFSKEGLNVIRVFNSATISLDIIIYPISILIHIKNKTHGYRGADLVEEVDDRFIENSLGQIWELMKDSRKEFLSLQESYEKGKPVNMGILRVPEYLKLKVDFVMGKRTSVIYPTFDFNFDYGRLHFFDESSYASAEEFFEKSFNLIEKKFYKVINSIDFSQK